MKNTKSISIKLPQSWMKSLDKLSKEQDRSISAIIRIAIREKYNDLFFDNIGITKINQKEIMKKGEQG
jgi:predicted DNA-binding protein